MINWSHQMSRRGAPFPAWQSKKGNHKGCPTFEAMVKTCHVNQIFIAEYLRLKPKHLNNFEQLQVGEAC